MNWIQNMNRCVGPASWDASKPKEKDMNTQEVPDWMIDATNIPKAEALQTLAHRLPDGWNIQIDIERGAGSVTLYAPDDIMLLADAFAVRAALWGDSGAIQPQDSRSALLKAVEALAVDAARYRWLRLNYDDSLVMVGGDKGCAEMLMEKELDRAVDSANQRRKT